MVVIQALEADVAPGDFLLAKWENGVRQSQAVCQVVNFSNDGTIEVIWWSPSSLVIPLCPTIYENLQHCRTGEVIPSLSSSMKESQVIDIYFAFSADFLEHVLVDCYGMSHVFFTQRGNHVPFSTIVDEIYPNWIWFSLIGMKNKRNLCHTSDNIIIAKEP
jgi:hypothetical protein